MSEGWRNAAQACLGHGHCPFLQVHEVHGFTCYMPLQAALCCLQERNFSKLPLSLPSSKEKECPGSHKKKGLSLEKCAKECSPMSYMPQAMSRLWSLKPEVGWCRYGRAHAIHVPPSERKKGMKEGVFSVARSSTCPPK